jgi:exonuclease 3'-5' domain-containing protein 2
MNNTRSIPVQPRAPPNAQRQPPKPTLPLYSWRGITSGTKLLYIRNCTEAESEVSKLGGGALGFDLEWRPTFVKGQPENPVALVQLANEDTILLIQISAMSS